MRFAAHHDSMRKALFWHWRQESLLPQGKNDAIDIAISDSYLRFMKVSVADAKNKLPKLIKAVENGESVTICRRGEPVVDIVPTKELKREGPKLGTMRGKIVEIDPDWWKPMTDEEVDAFLEGRY